MVNWISTRVSYLGLGSFSFGFLPVFAIHNKKELFFVHMNIKYCLRWICKLYGEGASGFVHELVLLINQSVVKWVDRGLWCGLFSVSMIL